MFGRRMSASRPSLLRLMSSINSRPCDSTLGMQDIVDDPTSTPALSSCLVYYSAVAKGTVVISEYCHALERDGSTTLQGVAAACLENLPSLHDRFSYTAHQRRFICLLDGVATYCAIMDEGLSKVDAFSFLHKVRDAFHAFGKLGRGLSLTLGAHFLDDEMTSVMRKLAASFVGIPQKEKDRIQAAGHQTRADGVDLDVSSPISALAPLYDVSDHDLNMRAELEGHLQSGTPRLPLIGKERKGKKETKEQAKQLVEKNDRKSTAGEDTNLEAAVDGPSDRNSSSYGNAHKLWRRKLPFVTHWIFLLA